MKRMIGAVFAVMMIFCAVYAFAREKESRLLLGYDSYSGILLTDSALIAGQRYYFPVFVSTGAAPVPLTDELMQKYSFKITNLSGGKGVKEISFTKRNGYYHISVLAEREAQHSYLLTLVERASGMDTLSLKVEFEVLNNGQAEQTVENPPTAALPEHERPD